MGSDGLGRLKVSAFVEINCDPRSTKRVGGFLPIPPKRCISGVRRSALEPIKRVVIADSHLWAKPKSTLYGVKNDDFASETLCRKEDVAVLRLKKFRIYPGAPMADTACRIDSIERALILRNQAV